MHCADWEAAAATQQWVLSLWSGVPPLLARRISASQNTGTRTLTGDASNERNTHTSSDYTEQEDSSRREKYGKRPHFLPGFGGGSRAVCKCRRFRSQDD